MPAEPPPNAIAWEISPEKLQRRREERSLRGRLSRVRERVRRLRPAARV